MTTEAQQLAIAEARGWRLKWQNMGGGPLYDTKPKGHCWEHWSPPRDWWGSQEAKSFHRDPHDWRTQPPSYLTNLNAIREVIDYARENYCDIEGDLFWCDWEFGVNANIVLDRNHWNAQWPLLLLSAAQYSEVFLRTLNLWKP